MLADERLRRARELAGATQTAFLDHIASVEGFAALTVGDHTTGKVEILKRPGEANAMAAGDLAEACIRSGAPAWWRRMLLCTAETLRRLRRPAVA